MRGFIVSSENLNTVGEMNYCFLCFGVEKGNFLERANLWSTVDLKFILTKNEENVEMK